MRRRPKYPPKGRAGWLARVRSARPLDDATRETTGCWMYRRHAMIRVAVRDAGGVERHVWHVVPPDESDVDTVFESRFGAMLWVDTILSRRPRWHPDDIAEAFGVAV